MRELGQAPELMYEPSFCNIALSEMPVTPEHASYGIDPGGIGDGYLRGVSLLHRTEAYVDRYTVERLRLERIRQRIPQREIGSALGITRNMVGLLELGMFPMTYRRAVVYGEILGVEVDYNARATALANIAARRESSAA